MAASVIDALYDTRRLDAECTTHHTAGNKMQYIIVDMPTQSDTPNGRAVADMHGAIVTSAEHVARVREAADYIGAQHPKSHNLFAANRYGVILAARTREGWVFNRDEAVSACSEPRTHSRTQACLIQQFPHYRSMRVAYVAAAQSHQYTHGNCAIINDIATARDAIRAYRIAADADWRLSAKAIAKIYDKSVVVGDVL